MATDHNSFEVLFVDNASTDLSVEWVQETYPSVRVVRHPENWAYCKGNNRAVEHARGEVLVLLNNDVEVEPDWLSPIQTAFLEDNQLGAAQPKIRQFVDRSMFEYAGAAGGFLDRDGYPFTRGRIFDTLEIDHGQYDEDVDLFWASGTALAFRKALFQELGGFEESFFMHMEEIDLCWRLKSIGYRVALIPESIVYHMGGASLSNLSSQKNYLNFRNNLLMLYRNLPPSIWRRVLVRRCVLDSLAFLKTLLAFKPAHAMAILRGYKDAFRMMGQFKQLCPSTAYHEPLPYRGSVVLDYYLRDRKLFSDLASDLFRSKLTK